MEIQLTEKTLSIEWKKWTHTERERKYKRASNGVCVVQGSRAGLSVALTLGGAGGGGGMEENGIEREGGTSFRVGLALQRVIAPGGGFGVQRHT